MSRHPTDPLRPLTADEEDVLGQISRSRSEPAVHVERAKLLLAVAAGASFSAAARAVGRRSNDAVAHLVSRFNREGLTALHPRHAGGSEPRYGPTERQHILAEAQRPPDRPHDGSASWSLSLACPASGQAGQGNIGVHSQKDRRFICRQCGKTFGARAGTLFHRRRTDEARITQVVTLLSYGCPVVAIEAAFDIQAQTIRTWGEAAGAHAEAVHHAQVVTARDLGHVQADELRIKTQCGIVWMAMAMMVTTRLWLGGVISTRRNQDLITRLVAIIAACAQYAPLLLLVDGLASYVTAFRAAFRTRQPSGRVGAPRKVPWPDLVIGQVITRTQGRRLVEITRRVVQGTTATLLHLLWQEPGCLVLNTAYIERLNGTFRARLAPLARRTHHLVHRREVVHASMYLVGAVYNFCTHHASLTTKDGTRRTPAMAAGIATQRWTISDPTAPPGTTTALAAAETARTPIEGAAGVACPVVPMTTVKGSLNP